MVIKKHVFKRAITNFLAEKEGIEPSRDLHPLAVFETAPFGRLGISPCLVIISFLLIC